MYADETALAGRAANHDVARSPEGLEDAGQPCPPAATRHLQERVFDNVTSSSDWVSLEILRCDRMIWYELRAGLAHSDNSSFPGLSDRTRI